MGGLAKKSAKSAERVDIYYVIFTIEKINNKINNYFFKTELDYTHLTKIKDHFCILEHPVSCFLRSVCMKNYIEKFYSHVLGRPV